MTQPDTNSFTQHRRDKQLQGIALEQVMAKRRLDQALNAKEFAVCAGISYSTARYWFHLPGFPVFHGVVFWQDFVQWRIGQNAFDSQAENLPQHSRNTPAVSTLPPQAAQILLES